MIEVWKDVVGYEGAYQVSDLGNVRSLDKVVRSRYKPRLSKGVNMKLQNNGCGYRHVSISSKTRLVHRIVAEAFIPRIVGKNCINHIDGNKQNNNISNLEWVTHKENSIHASKFGLFNVKKGELHHSAKLTNIEADQIRVVFDFYKDKEKISTLYKISITTLNRILRRACYA